MANLKDLLKQKKEKRYKNIFVTEEEVSSLVNQVGIQNILKSLGIDYRQTKTGVFLGYCPDHQIYCGRIPDKPKWYCFENGKTFCHTERRSSNIVTIAKNLLGLKNDREALERLLNGRELQIINVPKFAQVKKLKEQSLQLKQKRQKSLKHIQKILDEGFISYECLKYFEKDGISEQTLKKFGICSCRNGIYKDRAIIPFLNQKWELIGFNAVDYLGKEQWIKRKFLEYKLLNGEPENKEDILNQIQKKYRKVLFCPGFKSSEHLYGCFENVSYRDGIDYLVLVEGQRDCLKLMQQGIPCVALHGVNLSKQQTLMIEKISNKEVFLGFDMDEAGNKACESAYEILNDKIQSLYVLEFQEGKDPKKFNRSELLTIINNSRSNNIRNREYVVSTNVV